MASMIQKIDTFIDTARKMGKGPSLTRGEAKMIAAKAKLPVPSWLFNDAKYRQSHGTYYIPALANKQQVSVPVASTPMVTSTVASDDAPLSATATVANFARGVATVQNEIAAGTMIPARVDTYVPYGHFNDVKKIIASGKFFPIFITGLSGNGKTTMVEQVCNGLNREVVRVNFTNFTDEDDLLGGFRLVNGESVWQDGPVVVAMQRGAVLLLDELDYGDPRKINCLQSVLEHGRVFLKKMNRYVVGAAGFSVVATGNTKGQGGEGSEKFTGTNILNEAFLERFRITIEQEYPTKAVEKKIVLGLMDKANCRDESFADNLVKWAEIIRKSFFDGACDDIITTRRLEHIVEDFGIFGDRMKAVTHCTARFSRETADSFRSLYAKVDAEVAAPAASPEDAARVAAPTLDLTNANRIDLLGAGFAQRYEVKSLGAQWDANAKVWWITSELYAKKSADFSKYNPTPNATAGMKEVK